MVKQFTIKFMKYSVAYKENKNQLKRQRRFVGNYLTNISFFYVIPNRSLSTFSG